MQALAPITLFCYNRPEHLRRTVEALQKNELAAESELIIYSDGPKTDADAAKVNAVREYIRTISGFESVKINASPANKGLASSVIGGVTEVVNQYGRIIVLEDDLVTSPGFLRFMNDGLNVYVDEDAVISIHGYCYPVSGKLPETYFLKGADCWGWATWQRGWRLFEKDAGLLYKKLHEQGLLKQFDFDYCANYVQMLQANISGKNDSWAIRWNASAFIHNKYTLYPGQSLVNNIGFDNSGTNCGYISNFTMGNLCAGIKIKKAKVRECAAAYKQFRDFYNEIYKRNFSSGWLNRDLIKSFLPSAVLDIKRKVFPYKAKEQRLEQSSIFPGNQSSCRYYSTVLNHKFLPQLLALHDSMLAHCGNFKLYVICIDRALVEQLEIIKLPDTELIDLEKIEASYARMQHIKASRNLREYCWTLASFSFSMVKNVFPAINELTYLDTDLFFFSSPECFFKELDESGKDILITEHAFAPEHKYLQAESGLFCVQFITVKYTRPAEAVIKEWQDLCEESCSEKVENGKFGDQKYLEQWPDKYPDIVNVLKQQDKTSAPWNINYYSGTPVFYHFHGFRLLSDRVVKRFILPYSVNSARAWIYIKYGKSLVKQIKLIKQRGIAVPYFTCQTFSYWPLRSLKRRLINKELYWLGRI